MLLAGGAVPPGSLDDAVAAALRRRQLAPEPQLAAGRALAASGATAMIDISDGLGADAAHLAAASEVGLQIDWSWSRSRPGSPRVAAAAGRDPLDLSTASGEDTSVVTVPPERVDEAVGAVAAAGSQLTVIGEVTASGGLRLNGPSGPRDPAGFDQLRGSPAPDGPA